MKKEEAIAETQTQTIQRNITEGRQVVIKKENENIFVRIRYNNTDVDVSNRWRLLINGNEFCTAEVFINCPSRTFTEKFGQIGVKHHVVCEAKQVVFKNNIANID